MRNRLASCAMFLVAVGCNDSSLVRVPPPERVETYQQSAGASHTAPVDVLWVIDDSPSMVEEQQLLAGGFSAFAEPFVALGLDFHLGITSADPVDEAGRLIGDPAVLTGATQDFASIFRERALLGAAGGRREAGLQVARDALTEPLASTTNAGFLRADANLALVFLSDEDDQTLPAGTAEPPSSELDDPVWRAANLTPVEDLVRDFLALKGGDPERVFAAAIVGDPTGDPLSVANTCGEAAGGYRYADAVEALGGFWRSICGDASSFHDMLSDIAGGAVFGAMQSTFATDYEPVAGTIVVTVDGVVIPENPLTGWQWIAGQGVVFAPDAVPAACATVVIRYRVPEGVDTVPPAPSQAPGCAG